MTEASLTVSDSQTQITQLTDLLSQFANLISSLEDVLNHKSEEEAWLIDLIQAIRDSAESLSGATATLDALQADNSKLRADIDKIYSMMETLLKNQIQLQEDLGAPATQTEPRQ